MTAELIRNNVFTTTTYTFGRALNTARTHHFVVDGANEPTEEITPVEVFLAAVSSCAVHHVERWAREAGIPIDRVEARMEGARTVENPSEFQSISLRVDVYGTSQEHAEAFVAKFQSKCPLYGTVSKAVPVDVEVVAHD
jgi:uncharacterized OsmC-like protein